MRRCPSLVCCGASKDWFCSQLHRHGAPRAFGPASSRGHQRQLCPSLIISWEGRASHITAPGSLSRPPPTRILYTYRPCTPPAVWRVLPTSVRTPDGRQDGGRCGNVVKTVGRYSPPRHSPQDACAPNYFLKTWKLFSCEKTMNNSGGNSVCLEPVLPLVAKWNV